MGPLGHVLQDMAAGGDMAAAGGDMAAAAAAGGDMAAMTEAMMPAMTMSFLLPGIGLGLLKGMLLGNTNKYLLYLRLFAAELFRDRHRSYGHSYGHQQQRGYGQPQPQYGGYQQPQYGHGHAAQKREYLK